MLRIVLAAILFSFALPAQSSDDAALQLGREFTADFQQGKARALWDRMTPDLREAIGNPSAINELQKSLRMTAGDELNVLAEKVEGSQKFKIYLRTAEHETADRPIVTQFALGPDGRIAGFFVRPQTPVANSFFLDYRTKAPLRLPFDGEWKVYWGGRKIEQNYHAANMAQRFAYDFLVERDGASHKGDGSSLADYHCWKKPILAPAEGTVITAVDGLPDQKIGSSAPDNPAGNHVVLDFGNAEYGFLAHLKKGSITVSEGDKVASGTKLGLCGNSGNTSEPHLHLHLQNTPDLSDGEGLPAQFENYVANGEEIKRGEPVRGQSIRSAD